MPVPPRARSILLPMLLLLALPAGAWDRSIPGGAGPGGWTAVATAAGGDPVVAGQLGGELAAARLSGHSGAVLWSTLLGAGRAEALVLDAAGGAVVAGQVQGSGPDLAVARLDPRTGAPTWPAIFQRSGSASAFADETARGLALAAGGDVIAVGGLEGPGTGRDLAAWRLSGSDGSVVWESILDGGGSDFDGLNAVAVDPAGDIVVAGFVTNAGGTVDAFVAKLDGLTGSTVWDETPNGLADEFDQLDAVTTDAAGDVYAAGFLDNDGSGGQPVVVKLAGLDGTELWRRSLPGMMGEDQGSLVDLVVSGGSVWAAGARPNAGTGKDALVVRLDAVTGAVVWDVDLDGPTSGDDAATALILDATGMPVVVGHLRGVAGDDAWIARLDPASGAIDWQESRSLGAIPDRFADVAATGDGHIAVAGDEAPATPRDALAIARCIDGGDPGAARLQDAECDGVVNLDDVCPFEFDPGQLDADGDGIGDACPAAVLPLALVADLDDAPAVSIDLDGVPGRGEIRVAVDLARNRDLEIVSICSGADLAALEQDDAPNLEQFAPIKVDFADAKILPPESDDGEWVVPLFLYLSEDAFASPLERHASCFVRVQRGAGSTAAGAFSAELRTRTKPPAASVQSFCSDPAICRTGAATAENEAEYGEFIPDGADFQWRDAGDPALGTCVFLGGGDATSQPIGHQDAAQGRGWNCCEWAYQTVQGAFESEAGFSNFWVGVTPEDARPDVDLDGVLDRCDNCPGASASTFFDRNPGQENGDAILAGDRCQCTDVNASGDAGGDATDLVDVVLIARIGAGRAVPAHDPARCQLGASGDACSRAELAVLRGMLVAGQQPVDSCR